MCHRWARRIAKRYYDKLFKEYALADLSRYKEGKIGFRWRTEAEVIRGKGQFICGNKRCNESEGVLYVGKDMHVCWRAVKLQCARVAHDPPTCEQGTVMEVVGELTRGWFQCMCVCACRGRAEEL